MKIRQLSDLHLETGPFTWTDQGEDVVVLAGDIGVGTAGIEWAKTIPKPVIYVAGNHEYWRLDFDENLKAMRSAAKDSNVHFLENDEVFLTVNGETIRFLGCSLWTDFGAAHCKNHPVLLEDGRNPPALLMQHCNLWMNDYRNITAKSWWTEENTARYKSVFHAISSDKKLFNPVFVNDIHQISRAWLEGKFEEECDYKTVVVTHHAPSYQSLKEGEMIADYVLNQRNWLPSTRDEGGLYRIGAYASNLEEFLKRKKFDGSGVDLWFHGHLHTRVQYANTGAVVSCNPRGYHLKPLTQKDADSAWISGYPITPEAIERSEKLHAVQPERGNGANFERDLVIDTDTVLPDLVLKNARALIADLPSFITEVSTYLPYLKRKDQVIVKLAGTHIAGKISEFNSAVKVILIYLRKSLAKEFTRNRDDNYWTAVDLGLTENDGHLKFNSPEKKAVLRFFVDDDFRMPGPVNNEMEEIGFPGNTEKPFSWGNRVVKDMEKTIKGFEDRLEKCVLDLSA